MPYQIRNQVNCGDRSNIHRHTVIQSYSHTVIQSYSHTVIQSYRHTVIQSYSHTVIQSYSHTVIQSYSHTVIQSYSHTVIQSYSHTVIQSYSHTVIQSYSHTVIQSYSHIHCTWSRLAGGPLRPLEVLTGSSSSAHRKNRRTQSCSLCWCRGSTLQQLTSFHAERGMERAFCTLLRSIS